jgi:hypothetical protein
MGDRSEEMCKHGFPTPAGCPICKGKVEEYQPSRMVYVTEYGESYHFIPTCHALVYGQDLVRQRGGNPSPIETIAEEAAKNRYSRCIQCAPKR